MAEERPYSQYAEGNFIAQAAGPGATATVTVNVAPPRPVTPQQRPPRAEHFTGREEELAWLMSALQPGEMVSLCGTGGMGKTALAAEAIYRLEESGELARRFPDGVVVHSFYGQPGTAPALAHLVQSFLEGAQDFFGRCGGAGSGRKARCWCWTARKRPRICMPSCAYGGRAAC